MMVVTKAIIPAAGLGTRFLPATKVVPKEMLPLLDKPSIQYVVEEGVKSGIKDFVIITSRAKKVLEDHFDAFPELEEQLRLKKRIDVLDTLNKIVESTRFAYVRQHEQLGLGHAVWCAQSVVGDEYVAVMLPDDIIVGAAPGLAQLIKIAAQEKCSVVAVQEVPLSQVSQYGVISVKKQISPNLFQVKELVEKPSPVNTPSNLAIVGRYVLSPGIFESLSQIKSGALGEMQLTDGIQQLLFSGEKVFAYKIQGTRYDTGSPLGWLKANISMALRHQAYSHEMLEFLTEIDKEFLVMQGKAENLRRPTI